MKATLFALLLSYVLLPLFADDAYSDSAQTLILPTAAQDVLVHYSSAFNQGDCDAMLEVISPSVFSRMTNTPDGKEGFCSAMRSIHNELVVESLGKVLGIKSEGRYHMAMIENERVVGRSDSTMQGGASIYVLHSYDGGEKWWMLDLSCVDSNWIKEVYPPYDGDPPIPYRSTIEPES